MQFTIVREVPLVSSGAVCATNVENKGESAITTRPQKNRKTINATGDGLSKKNGETIQHKPDKHNEIPAIFLAPYFCDSNPLNTQARPPQAITKKDKRETSNFT